MPVSSTGMTWFTLIENRANGYSISFVLEKRIASLLSIL